KTNVPVPPPAPTMKPALVTRKRTVPESAYDGHAVAISIKPAANIAAPHFTAREKPNIIVSLPFVILTTVTPASAHLQGRTSGCNLVHVTRRSFLPRKIGATLFISVFKQRLHVAFVEGAFVRDVEVVVDRCKVEIDAIPSCEQKHSVGVVHAARGNHRRQRLLGDRNGLQLHAFL